MRLRRARGTINITRFSQNYRVSIRQEDFNNLKDAKAIRQRSREVLQRRRSPDLKALVCYVQGKLPQPERPSRTWEMPRRGEFSDGTPLLIMRDKSAKILRKRGDSSLPRATVSFKELLECAGYIRENREIFIKKQFIREFYLELDDASSKFILGLGKSDIHIFFDCSDLFSLLWDLNDDAFNYFYGNLDDARRLKLYNEIQPQCDLLYSKLEARKLDHLIRKVIKPENLFKFLKDLSLGNQLKFLGVQPQKSRIDFYHLRAEKNRRGQ